MIHYNDPKFTHERSISEALSMKEVKKVISVINTMIAKCDIDKDKEDLIQRFVYNYELLEHHASSNISVTYHVVESKMNE